MSNLPHSQPNGQGKPSERVREIAEWLRPEPEPEPKSLPIWLMDQSSYYLQLGSETGLWLSQRLRRLAETADFLHAEDVATFDDREKALVSRD